MSVRGLLPADRPSRLLALATIINTFGDGLFFTVVVGMIALPIAFGTPGWIALGLLIAGVPLAVVPVARWGQSARVVTD